jgi:integrase
VQQGQLFKRSGAWYLRFYRDEIVNGKAVRRRVCKWLAPKNNDYRSKKDLQDLIRRELAPVNTGALPEGGLTFADFYEHHFLPHVQPPRRKASTFKFYRDIFRYHLRARVGSIRLRDFTTAHAQGVLDSIDLTHKSLLRIKTAMSAAFTVARQKDFIRTANPITGAKAEGKRTKFRGYAYTLAEIKHMLAVLGEPARTVVAVAAFTGMREGEIRGLCWPDYTGTTLHVQRAVWRTFVDDTKTDDSEGFVPVIGPLRVILDAHKRHGHATDGYIFAGPKKNFALNLDNLAKREIRPVLGTLWHGFHAFRRGLTTNLYELGVPPEVSQIILRHAAAETTRRHYLILEQQKHGAAAMRQFEKAINKAGFGQKLGKSKSGKQPRKSRKTSMDTA